VKGRDFLRKPGMDGKKILKYILMKHDGRARTASVWLRMQINGWVC
jgi:hypothetical protein